MKKFEYMTAVFNSEIQSTLNEYGSHGWELTTIRDNSLYIFKREIQEVKTLDQTPMVGKRVSYGGEDCPYDTGIITKIEDDKIWVRWSDGNVRYIWSSDFENGRTRIIK